MKIHLRMSVIVSYSNSWQKWKWRIIGIKCQMNDHKSYSTEKKKSGKISWFLFLKIFWSFPLGNRIERTFCLPTSYLEFFSPSIPPFSLFLFKYSIHPTYLQNSGRFSRKYKIERPYVQTPAHFKQAGLIAHWEKKKKTIFLFAFDFFQKDKMKGTVIHILSPVNSQWGFRIKR